MSSDPQALSVTLAAQRAAAARQRLSQTASTLQARLHPKVVARDAVENLQETGGRALRNGVATARANPEALVWAATLAIGWLARDRIAGLFGRPRKRKHDRETPAQLARSIPGDWPEAAERNNI